MIIFGGRDLGEVQQDITHGLEGGFGGGLGHHVLGDFAFGFAELVVEEELSHIGEGGGGIRVGRIVRTAGPESGFIEADNLGVNAAEHHRPLPAVAERQRLRPLRGGLAIPEGERFGGHGRFALQFTGVGREAGGGETGAGREHRRAADSGRAKHLE